MAAAGAFGVEGVDGAALEGRDACPRRSRDSFSVSVWIITCTSKRSATDRQLSIAAGVVPQSSCSFRQDGAGAHHFLQRLRAARRCPCRRSARLTGRPSAACSMRAMCHGPGVQVVAAVPVGRAGAAADHRGDAGGERLLDLLRADEMDVAVDAAGGEDLALAGDDFGARADDDVDAGLHVGVAGLADRGDAAVRDGDVGFDDAPMVDDQRVGDDGVDRALRPARPATGPCRRGSPCRRRTSLPRRRW